MKRLVTALALMLTLSATTISAASLHRHHSNATSVVKSDKGEDDKATKDEVEAFSDTTSSVNQNDSATTKVLTPADFDDEDINDKDFVDKFAEGLLGGTIGAGTGFFALVVVILVFLFLTAPFIIAIIAIWFAYKRHRNRERLIQSAIENGQPIPQEALKTEHQTDDYLWKKGIKNISVGIGLVFLFWILGADPLIGIGLLVACIGAGQAFIARTSKKHDSEDDLNNPTHNESI